MGRQGAGWLLVVFYDGLGVKFLNYGGFVRGIVRLVLFWILRKKFDLEIWEWEIAIFSSETGDCYGFISG